MDDTYDNMMDLKTRYNKDVMMVEVGFSNHRLDISHQKNGESKSAEDYFLAGKSLPWWTIGASLIAANISAEQFIGMSASAFALGLAIASYEWIATITLLVVGKYFLPTPNGTSPPNKPHND